MLGGTEAYQRGITVREVPRELWEKEQMRGRVYARCMVCERRCLLAPGMRGFCWNRFYDPEKGLVTDTYGLLSAVESRPIEIKPLFHYWPGSTALTFSGWGCSFRCPWCQNSQLSWSRPRPEHSIYLDPSELAELAKRVGDEGICASFNEPGVHLEYLVDAGAEARKRGLYATMVTNAYFTHRALKLLLEAGYDGFSIDIKGCPETYRRLLAASPYPVLRNAKTILDNGGHVEMVFLIVPRANDTPECIQWVLEKTLDALGPQTPLHINRYYPANRWAEPPTPLKTLLYAYREAKRLGYEYVYIGNTGNPEYEATRCPKCGKLLIERRGYHVTYYNLTRDNRCPRCGYKINIRGRYTPKPYEKRWRTLF